MRTCALPALLLGLTACQPDPSPILGEKVYESDNFEVYASDGLVACGGTFQNMEDWLASFRGRLGEHALGKRHRFFWLSEDDFAMSPCPDDSGGCAARDRRHAYSRTIPFPHEVAHLELDYGSSPDFLSEGAAEVFGAARSAGELTEPVPVARIIDGNDWLDSDAHYAEAGKLSRFLLDEFGDEAYFALYRAMPRNPSRMQIDQTMRSTLGASLDAILQAYEDFNPACHVEQWRFHDVECVDMPPVPWEDDGAWRLNVSMECSEPTAVGPRAGRVWTRRAFDVDEQATYEIRIASSDPLADARLRVVACEDSCMPGEWSPTLQLDVTDTAYRQLRPGRHWIHLSVEESSSADVEVAISRFS